MNMIKNIGIFTILRPKRLFVYKTKAGGLLTLRTANGLLNYGI